MLSATLSVFTQQLLGAIAHIANTVIITNVFGAKGFGTYVIAILLATLLSTTFSAGLPIANIYFINAKGMQPVSAWKASLLLSLALIAAGEIVGLGGLYILRSYFFDDASAVYWLLIGLLFPAQLLLGLSLSMLQAKQHFQLFNRISLIQPFCLVLTTISIWWVGISDITAIIIAHTVCTLLTLTTAIYCVYAYALCDLSGKTAIISWPTLLKFGLKAHSSNVATMLNYKLDSLLLNALLGHSAVGVYNVAIQISERLWMLSQAASVIVLPRSASATKDDHDYLQVLTTTCRWVLAITSSGGLCISLIGYPLIPLVFGDSFAGAWNVFNILVIGTTALAFSRILANDIAAKGKPELNLHSSLTVLAVNTVLNLTLIPSLGIAGAAMATSSAYVISSMLIIYFHRKHIANYPLSSFILSKRDVINAVDYLKARRHAK